MPLHHHIISRARHFLRNVTIADLPPRKGLTDILSYTWRCWRPYRLVGFGIITTTILYKVFFLYFAYHLQFLVDGTLEGGQESAVLRFSLGVVGVLPFIVALNIVREWLTAEVRVNIANDIRIELFEHLQCLSLEFYTLIRPAIWWRGFQKTSTTWNGRFRPVLFRGWSVFCRWPPR
jgi:ABC-type multidrug transport system fused ATPase/permease subunit